MLHVRGRGQNFPQKEIVTISNLIPPFWLSTLVLCVTSCLLLQSCAVKPKSANHTEQKFLKSIVCSLVPSLNAPSVHCEGNSANGQPFAGKYQFAITESTQCYYSILLLICEDGTAIAPANDSPTGFQTWKMEPEQLEQFQRLNSELNVLQPRKYGGHIPITDLGSTIFFTTDSSGNHQRISVYGDFLSNELFLNAEDRRMHCTVPEILKTAFNKAKEVKRVNARVWLPDNVSFDLTASACSRKADKETRIEFDAKALQNSVSNRCHLSKSDLSEKETDLLLKAYQKKESVIIHGQHYRVGLSLKSGV